MMNIRYVIIEFKSDCPVCRATIPKIIPILKKYNIFYVLRNIGDEHLSSYEENLKQPTFKSLAMNKENIKNPDLKKIAETKDVATAKRFDAFVKSVNMAPRIYIVLSNFDDICIDGIENSEEFYDRFEELIEMLLMA